MKTQAQTTPAPAQDLAVIRTEILSQSNPLTKQVNSLAVVDPPTYAKADTLLSRVTTVRKGLKDRVGTILEPLDNAKREIDKSRKELTRFRDELDEPLERMELTIRGLMQDFKREELRQLREAEEQRLETERRDRMAAEEARRKAEQASTPQLQRRLENKAMELDTRADMTAAAPKEAPVLVAHSGSRVVRKVRVTDRMALYKAIVAGDVPMEIAPISESALEQARRINEDLVKTWPGCEIWEDVQIVRR